MISKLKLAFLCLIVGLVGFSKADEWDYDPDNPNAWNEQFPACAGTSQSPIDIRSSTARYNSTLKPIVFKNYNLQFLFNFTNNGHTIVGNPFKDNITGLVPYITGSDFGKERFDLLQLHFHWGSNATTGSEHLLNGKGFAGELHLVHQSKESGKLAVIGFFLSVTNKNNTNLNDLLKAVISNSNSNSVTKMYLALTSILPNLDQANAFRYFRYSGSLTTPPCSEGIIWTVYRLTIQISSRQMRAFYDNTVKFNYRPVQPMNGRRLFTS